MSYKLTLTKEDRKAIDWIGDRYVAAPILRRSFVDSCPDGADWDFDGDLTVDMEEHRAWQIQVGAECDMEGGHSAWPCFAPELRDKLNAFLDSVV